MRDIVNYKCWIKKRKKWLEPKELKRKYLWYVKNKPRIQVIKKQHYQRDKQIIRDRNLKAAYNLTPVGYNLLLKKQKNVCATCGVSQSRLKKYLFVDHDHKTNRIRGLLCCSCNFGLGSFKDNKRILKSAITYLKRDV